MIFNPGEVKQRGLALDQHYCDTHACHGDVKLTYDSDLCKKLDHSGHSSSQPGELDGSVVDDHRRYASGRWIQRPTWQKSRPVLNDKIKMGMNLYFYKSF